MLSIVGLKNISHIILSGRGLGVLSRKILKIKKEGETISGTFEGPILHSVNKEFQRILLQFICMLFLNIRFRKICICLFKSCV